MTRLSWPDEPLPDIADMDEEEVRVREYCPWCGVMTTTEYDEEDAPHCGGCQRGRWVRRYYPFQRQRGQGE